MVKQALSISPMMSHYPDENKFQMPRANQKVSDLMKDEASCYLLHVEPIIIFENYVLTVTIRSIAIHESSQCYTTFYYFLKI